MSNLSAFGYIQERSEATPGLFNLPLSIISANIAALDSGLTSSSPSGNTFSFLTNIETSGGAHFQHLSVGSTPPSYVTTAAITVEVNSAYSDYLYFVDSSAQKSSYIIGSRAGGLSDGLVLWDVSGSTVIANFSKQSVRYFTPVIGTLYDFGGAVVNVDAYGCVGDGISDDQAFINQAISERSTGGVIAFSSKKTYRITNHLSFSNSTGLIFEGNGATIIQATANKSVFDGGTVQNVLFRNLNLVGTGTASVANDGAGIVVSSATNVVIESCSFTSYGNVGVYCGLVSGFVIRNSFFSSGRASNNVGDSSDIYILNGSAYGVIDGNFCGIGRSSGNSDGIVLTNSPDNMLIVNNVVGPKRMHGILVYNNTFGSFDSATNEGVLVANNRVSGCSFTNIYINNSKYVRVIGNHVSAGSNAGNSLGLEGSILVNGGGYNVVANNSVVTGWMGIKVHTSGNTSASLRDIVVMGNSITSTHQQGIFVDNAIPSGEGVNVIVSGNIVEQPQNHGIHVYGGSSATYRRVTITGNSVTSGTNDGIRIDRVEQAIIQGNMVSFMTLHGIDVNASTDVVVSDNLVSRCVLNGIVADNGSARVMVTDNSSRGNNYGVNMASVNSYRVFNNDLSNNTTGGFTQSVSSNSLQFDNCPIILPNGTLQFPSMAFNSEASLGFYRQGPAVIGVPYGNIEFMTAGSRVKRLVQTEFWKDATPTLAASVGQWDPGAGSITNDLVLGIYNGSAWTASVRVVNLTNALAVLDGTALAPTFAFNSNQSVGFYSSGVQTIAQSYGTFDLTATIASLGTIRVKSGANNSCGTAVLGSNGSVNVANTYVKTGDLIFLTDQTAGGTLGDLEIGGIRNSSGFTILSTSVTDTSTVAWLIIRPG